MPKFFMVRQAWSVARKRNQLGCGGLAGDLEVKVLYTPGKRGVLARGKGGARVNCEHEGSPRQNAGLTNRKRMRRHGVVSPKPNTCTERCDVNPTGISRKVERITLGDLEFCRCATKCREATR